MSHRASFRGTLIGLVAGSAVTVVGIGLFTLALDKTWPMRVIQVSALLGLWAMRDCHQGFPIDVSAAKTNSLLVLAGALQWGLAGFIYDLGRLFVTNRGK
jgi:hypothetical protein